MASGTWANKESHLRLYITFTVYYGVPDFPVHSGVLLRFMAMLSRGSYSYDSASNIISSIKWFASLLDPPSLKVFDAIFVTVTKKGLRAQLSRPARQKLPFSVEHLVLFYDSLDLSKTKHLACWCAMVLAFFGCFRLSNLVSVSKNKFDPLKHLKRDDIKFEGDMVLIFYKWSKTNQHCDKVSWIPIKSVVDFRFNLKRHLKRLFSLVDAPKEAPLFSFAGNDYHSRYTLIRMLDKCVFNAGLSVADYSWHSFRRGSAVFAFELGLADSAVQLLGDWSSAAFKHYLEFAFSRKISVARKIAKSFDKLAKSI